MGIEQMITEAVLLDRFTGPLRRIAGEQDAYARKTAALNMGGNALIGMGSGMIAFAVHSAKVAGEIDSIRKALTAVEGAQKAAFDMDAMDKFAQHSKFTYLEVAHAGERLALANVSVTDTLGDMADLAAKSHKPLAQVAKVYDTLLASKNVSNALSARGGFSQFYISPRSIFEAAGKQYTPGMKLQGSITPEEVAAAIHKVLAQSGSGGLNEKLARTTMEGAEGMISDALTRVSLNVVSGKNLADTIQLLDVVADDLNKVADAAAKVPNLGAKILGTGAGLVAAGGLLKLAGGYRELRNMLNLTKIAGAAERAGEKAKGPIADAEGNAVKGVAGKYGGLIEKLKGVGTAATAGTAAEGVFGSALAAGAVTVGAYAVALAGVVAVGYELVSMWKDAGDASTAFEASTAAMNKAEAEGYDFKKGGGKAQGYDALPLWKQIGYQTLNTWSFGLASKLTGGAYDEEHSGITATSDAASRALAKKHGMAPRGVRAQQIEAEKQAAAAAAEARRQAQADARQQAGDAANRYEIPPQLQYKIEHDKREFEYQNRVNPNSKIEEAARKTEIEDLMKARDLLLDKAQAATDVAAKYKLMGQADEYDYEARNMDVTKEKKDKRDKLDKHIATLLGAGGLSEDEFLKRTGINGRFLSQVGKGRVPENPLKTALHALAKQPLIVNVHIGNKPFEQIKTEITNSTVQALLRAVEGSNPRALFGGH